MSKFSNFKIKCPKSVEKLDNGDRLGPPPPRLAPPQKKQKKTLDPPLRSAPKYCVDIYRHSTTTAAITCQLSKE